MESLPTPKKKTCSHVPRIGKEKASFTNNSLICTMKRQRVQHRRMIHSISQTAPKSLKSINRSDGASRWVDEGWNCVLGQNPMKDSAVAEKM